MKFCADDKGMVRGRPLTHTTSPSPAGVSTLDGPRDAELLRRRLLFDDAWDLVDMTLSSVYVTCPALASRDCLPVALALKHDDL